MRRAFSTLVTHGATNAWLLISRVAVGSFMLTHGIPKLELLMAGNVQFADPLRLGPPVSMTLTVFAEALCSALLILGLATRFAVIPLIINMCVAAFVALGAQPFAKKELALLYLVFFAGFFILGGGKYSLDYLISGKGRSRY